MDTYIQGLNYTEKLYEKINTVLLHLLFIIFNQNADFHKCGTSYQQVNATTMLLDSC